MILTEFIDVTVEKRNLRKLRSILGDGIQRNTVVRVYRQDFYALKNCATILIVCDMCGSFHNRKLSALVKKQKNQSSHICNHCIFTVAAEKMRCTVRTPAHRQHRSNKTTEFYQTEYSKTVKANFAVKFRKWISTPAGQLHVERSTKRLPRLIGKNHPNYNPNLAEYQRYKSLVRAETNRHDISILANYDKPRGLCGVKGGYQLDHIIPIKYGFDNGIDPSIIGSIENLQFISWEENRKKWHKIEL